MEMMGEIIKVSKEFNKLKSYCTFLIYSSFS